MRVLGILPNYPPHSLVGAWITTHQFLAHLVTRGHRVTVCAMNPGPNGTVDGVDVVRPVDEIGLQSFPHHHATGADLVVCHLGDDLAAKASRHLGIPRVWFSHAAPRDGAMRRNPDLVIANSQHTADALHPSTRRLVIHPPVFPEHYRTTPGDKVTLINLSKPKGGDLFRWLVEAMPDVDFLGVVGGHGKQGPDGDLVRFKGRRVSDGNLAMQPSVPDARDVYSQTRILLMPSQFESYGRTAVEAACSGIPTIANPTPGLLEAMGDAATWCDWDDPDAWVKAIRSLSKPTAYKAAAKKARARADQLDPQADLDRFAVEVEALVGVTA